MRSTIIASRMPNNNQINWVALKLKMRCSRSGSRCEVLTSDTLSSFDISFSCLQIRGAQLRKVRRGAYRVHLHLFDYSTRSGGSSPNTQSQMVAAFTGSG